MLPKSPITEGAFAPHNNYYIFSVKIRIEYNCNVRWIEQKVFNTSEIHAKHNVIYNLINAFKDDEAAWIDEDSAIVERIC